MINNYKVLWGVESACSHGGRKILALGTSTTQKTYGSRMIRHLGSPPHPLPRRHVNGPKADSLASSHVFADRNV